MDVRGIPDSSSLPPEPKHVDEMCHIAERLLIHFTCTCVDSHLTIASESTHTTSGGHITFDPPDFDQVFGRFWRGDATISDRFFSPAPDRDSRQATWPPVKRSRIRSVPSRCHEARLVDIARSERDC